MGGSLTNGTDTTEAKPVAQDVFGFSLHYFRNDYKAIWFNPQASSVIGGLTTNASPLYNGNIAAMAVNIPKLSSTKLYNYKYDQLNRLVAMDLFNGLNPVAGSFTASISTEYRERVSYDPNGNIKSYQRNGDAARLTMDNLAYHYRPNTNQLHRVYDSAVDASVGVYPNYQDLRTGQADNYYKYDSIGNLIKEGTDSIIWNVYGKIERIIQSGNDIRYTYDAAGNRISKSTSTDTTFYVRDASGNVLSVYRKPAAGQINQEEVHLYGSSRLGMVTRHLAPDSSFSLVNSFGKIYSYKFTRGEKLFELSNHLGNVLVTLSDRVQQVKVTGDTVRHYLADVRSANDYYPFGMLMPGRKFNAGSFRYGFNGKENDNEVKGSGNQQDYGMRIYDPRISKFLSVDPIAKLYPELTPFQFASNCPITMIDLDGLEGLIPSGIPNPISKSKRPIGMILTPEDASAIKKKTVVKAFQAAFNQDLPKRLINHYSYGAGRQYILSKYETENLNIYHTGLHGGAPNDINKTSAFLATIKNGETKELPDGYSIQGGAGLAGTLGRFKIELCGKVTKDKKDGDIWRFEGQMRFIDTYDFKGESSSPGDLERSEWGDFQTRFAENNLPGTPFEIRSEWINVKQDNSNFFDWFNGKSSKDIPNKFGGGNSKEAKEIRKIGTATNEIEK
ncbi:RHS repeat domain-containing protein [Flavihumibacter sp. UBA7668]|uniref:RHS repeat domain-containing protein n=1 Tax=Flavihumibacter sp. UBA7668 TaxID=1946542 RepID=UPI0025C2BD48|nr:RHS repeat-associated core domain-containing protein [Flavihumibacter sp. UBA7668]